ncbi:hypothetical protein ACIRON_02960 [Nocardioides sp. NPDC101246]|uniref:hypothetical protein n=1 Tax=Nocardioides sp. NPDC101246 TaxID=3364336 RepID=UPI003805D8BD
MRKGSANTRARAAVSSLGSDGGATIFVSIVARHWLPAAHKQVTERPELAGVGIAADVLDAVTWGA